MSSFAATAADFVGTWNWVQPNRNPNTNYTLAAAQLADSGSYACMVTNPLGSVTSTSVNFVVSPQPFTPPPTPPTTPTTPVTPPPTNTGTPPTFAAPPGDLNLSLRSAVIVNYGALGDPPISYQWYKDGVALPGATGSLRITNAQKSDAGTYILVATNAAGHATSSPMVVRIKMVAPTITEQPKSIALVEGESLTLSTAATADPDPTFQWYKNGVAYGQRVIGAPRSTILLGGGALEDAGDYTCVVTNEAGSVTSAVATVSVTRPARIVNLSSRGFTEGGTFTVGFVVEGSVYPSAARAGGFSLPATSADAAILIDLPAGNYTAQTSGIGAAGGAVLFELYLAP